MVQAYMALGLRLKVIHLGGQAFAAQVGAPEIPNHSPEKLI